MRLFKIYHRYTVFSRVLWILSMVLVKSLSWDFFANKKGLFDILVKISTYIFILSLIPVIPVLWLIIQIRLLMKKEYSYVISNLWDLCTTVVLWFFFFIYQAVWASGGV